MAVVVPKMDIEEMEVVDGKAKIKKKLTKREILLVTGTAVVSAVAGYKWSNFKLNLGFQALFEANPELKKQFVEGLTEHLKKNMMK